MAIPAVYVTIEDASFALPQIDTGRVVYQCIMSDRGPHNAVVELNSVAQSRRTFGKPNMPRTGIGHYLLEKALQYTGKVYAVRPVLLDSTTETDNAALANASIKYNDPNGSYQAMNGNKFIFSNEADIKSEVMAKRIYTNRIGYEQFDNGDYIVSSDDGETGSLAGIIASKHQDANDSDLYFFLLEEAYTGTSTIDETDNLLYHGEIIDQATNTYKFYEDQAVVETADQASYDSVEVGDWIFPTGAVANRVQQSVQVLTKVDATAGVAEESGVTVDSGGAALNLNNDYFLMESPNDQYFVWYNMDGTGSNPNLTEPALSTMTGIEVAIGSGDNDDSIASKTAVAIDGDFAFESTAVANEITIVNVVEGATDNAIHGTAGQQTIDFTYSVSVPGITAINASFIVDSNFTGDTSAVFEVLSKYIPNVNSTANTIDINREGDDDLRDAVNAIEYFPAIFPIASASYDFVNGSNIVKCTGISEVAILASYNGVSEEEWIFPGSDTTVARQIIKKQQDLDEDSSTYLDYQLILDAPFTGDDAIDSIARSFVPMEIVNNINIRGEANIDETDADNIWSFYAVGAGKWYNKLYMVGRRNTALEKMFVDNDGEPLYPHMFMDLYVYQQNDDGSVTLMEGPWSVSLIKEIPTSTGDKQIIRDLNTGKEMYIETVINDRSEFIRCKEAFGIEKILNEDVGEVTRLQIQTMFATGTVTSLDTRGYEGFFMEKGEDGVQYDDQDRLNLGHGKIEGLLVQAYNGTLTSTDSSIELIVQTLYPRYQFDYVVAGGYSKNIQNAARQLCDTRQDCMCLGDTGYNTSANDDINARENDVPWNSFNAMLYSQFRTRFDEHTGTSKYWFTPVYHALEQHLYVDNTYWISEPVAGIEKGAISESIKLAYKPAEVKMNDLMDKEVNVTISEPDGKYFLTQFTTWKRLSVMKRAHAVKFVHYLKKAMPPLLKDILQRKSTPFWVDMVDQRIKGFMQPFTATSGNYASITEFSSVSAFDEARSEINTVLTIHPLRAIEAINVHIVVT
jgi:hypothetical protein